MQELGSAHSLLKDAVLALQVERAGLQQGIGALDATKQLYLAALAEAEGRMAAMQQTQAQLGQQIAAVTSGGAGPPPGSSNGTGARQVGLGASGCCIRSRSPPPGRIRSTAAAGACLL